VRVSSQRCDDECVDCRHVYSYTDHRSGKEDINSMKCSSVKDIDGGNANSNSAKKVETGMWHFVAISIFRGAKYNAIVKSCSGNEINSFQHTLQSNDAYSSVSSKTSLLSLG
jgi:hypothetical protein